MHSDRMMGKNHPGQNVPDNNKTGQNPRSKTYVN